MDINQNQTCSTLNISVDFVFISNDLGKLQYKRVNLPVNILHIWLQPGIWNAFQA